MAVFYPDGSGAGDGIGFNLINANILIADSDLKIERSNQEELTGISVPGMGDSFSTVVSTTLAASQSGAVHSIWENPDGELCFRLDGSGVVPVSGVINITGAEYPLDGTYRITDISGFLFYCTSSVWASGCFPAISGFGIYQVFSGVVINNVDNATGFGISDCTPNLIDNQDLAARQFNGITLNFWANDCLERLGCVGSPCTDITTFSDPSGVDYTRSSNDYSYCLGSFIKSADTVNGERDTRSQ